MMGNMLIDLDEKENNNKESKEVVQEILNDAIRFAVMSTETGSPPSWKEYIMTNQGVGNFTSPLTQPVPVNSPTDLMNIDVPQQAEPATLNRALSAAINKLPKNANIKTRTELEQDKSRIWNEKSYYNRNAMFQHSQLVPNENVNTPTNHFHPPYGYQPSVEGEIKCNDRIISELDPLRCPEFVPRSTSTHPSYNPLSRTKLNPNAPPFQTQNPESFRVTIDNLNCMKMTNRENEPPIRNSKLESQIKKLIKEIQEIDFGVRQSTEVMVAEGQGDVELEDDAREAKIIEMEMCEETLTQKIIELESTTVPSNVGGNTVEVKKSELPNNAIKIEALVTKKSCQMDLISHSTKNNVDLQKPEPLKLHLGERDHWEETHEQEIRIINPEYSSSNSESELIQPSPVTTPLCEIDLCGISCSAEREGPSSGGKGDICDQAVDEMLSVPPNTPEVQAGDDTIPAAEKDVSRELSSALKLSANGQTTPDKKNKKKKWTFGNRILGLFTKNKHTSSGVVSDIKNHD